MKKRFNSLFVILALTVSLQFAIPNSTIAQCPMCKMSAEQNLKDGGTAGKGLNTGILYLFLTPYLVVGGIGYFWYRNRRKEVV